MGRNKVLTAVTIPKMDYSVLEEISKKRKVSRSALISDIIHQWLDSLKKEKLIRQYEKGYQKYPEELTHITALEKVGLGTMSKESWE